MAIADRRPQKALNCSAPSLRLGKRSLLAESAPERAEGPIGAEHGEGQLAGRRSRTRRPEKARGRRREGGRTAKPPGGASRRARPTAAAPARQRSPQRRGRELRQPGVLCRRRSGSRPGPGRGRGRGTRARRCPLPAGRPSGEVDQVARLGDLAVLSTEPSLLCRRAPAPSGDLGYRLAHRLGEVEADRVADPALARPLEQLVDGSGGVGPQQDLDPSMRSAGICSSASEDSSK